MPRVGSRIPTPAILLLLAPALCGAAGLAELDTRRELAGPLGSDRISKVLVAGARAGQDRIDARLADAVLVELLERPDTAAAIARGLCDGDALLFRGLSAALGLLGLSPEESAAALAEWAGAGEVSERTRRLVASALAQPSCVERLRDYVLGAPEDHARFVAGIGQQWSGTTPLARFLRDRARATLRDEGLWDRAAEGDLGARRDIAETLCRWLDVGGAFATQMVRVGGGSPRLYPLFWDAFHARLASDPLLVREWVTRAAGCESVYSSVQAALAESLRDDGGAIFAAYLRASDMPESRYEWVCRSLLGDAFRGSATPLADGARSSAQSAWSGRVASDPGWADYLMWHLTRPASVAGQSALAAVTRVLSTDPQAAELVANIIAQKGPAAREAAERCGADTPEFRRLRVAGGLRSSHWAAYGARIGARMEADWDLAQEILGAAGLSPAVRSGVNRIVSSGIAGSNDAIRVWTSTMVQADLRMRDSFLRWMVARGKARDLASALRWLQEAAAQATATGSARVAVGQWKEYFPEWARGAEGAGILADRLSIDLWGITGRLRASLVGQWRDQPDLYWRWRSAASGLPRDGAGIVWAGTSSLVQAEGFAEAYLAGCRAGDTEMLDLIEPVWREMFGAPDGAIIRAFQEEMASGPVGGDAFGAAALGLRDAVERRQDRAAAVLASLGIPWGLQGLRERLERDADSLRPGVIAGLLADREIWSTWRASLFSAVLFAGKARGAADLVATRQGLADAWGEGVRRLMETEPRALRIAMAGLARQRAGDLEYAARVRAWEKRLMDADASNQILFEQLLRDRGGGYRARFMEEAARALPNLRALLSS